MTTTAELPTLAEPLDAVTPRDRRRAAELLACAVSGDRFGVSAAVVSAQRMDRVGATLHAVAALVVDTVPELDTTALVDRLREQSVPPPSLPKPSRSPRPVTTPGVYLHNGVRYEVVRTRDGQRLYVKVWDEDARRFVYDADGLKVADLRADEALVTCPELDR